MGPVANKTKLSEECLYIIMLYVLYISWVMHKKLSVVTYADVVA